MSQHGCPERLSNRSKGFPDEGQSTMEVLVETLTGTAFEITVSPSDTIFAIKSKICRVEGIPVSQQHLLYNLVELEDSLSLASAGVTSGARLRLVLGLRGGPISTRRLPPPSEPWPDIDDKGDSNRDDDWCGGSGCKVTVLVYRDGERVSMVRVRENTDGTYSPLDTTNYGSSLGHVCEAGSSGRGDRSEEVRLSKVAGLRDRLRDLALHSSDKPEIQKTRSEETLSVPSLLDEPERTYTPYSEADDAFTPLYDGNYTRYDYDFTDRYTILPPIGTRSDSEQSVQDELKLHEVAGAIVVEDAILEECVDELSHDKDIRLPDTIHIQPLQYGTVLPPPRLPPPPRALSSSSPSLSVPPNQSPITLPLLRHRPTEHLHLTDTLPITRRDIDHTRLTDDRRTNTLTEPIETIAVRTIDVETKTVVQLPEKEKKIRLRCGFCRKRLTIATVHKCRCGAQFCAPHRYAEVHGCAYDYKANALPYLQRANPLVSAPKLPKI